MGQVMQRKFTKEMNHTLRQAGTGDAAELLEFAARTYSETFSPVNTPENMKAYMESAFTMAQLEEEMLDAHALFLLVEIDGFLCAYAKLLADKPPDCIPDENAIEIVRFYVDRPWHGSGLASTLMEACLAEAKKRGFKTIYLGVWERNFRAQAFYGKWNFVRVGEHVFPMADDPQIDWWMMRGV
jgi:ribosomal protein S18 acetylase RimI-like enzyme